MVHALSFFWNLMIDLKTLYYLLLIIYYLLFIIYYLLFWEYQQDHPVT